MARTAKEREGRVPLSTLQRATSSTARLSVVRRRTAIIGVKVWIYKGDIERGQKINYRFHFECWWALRAAVAGSTRRWKSFRGGGARLSS